MYSLVCYLLCIFSKWLLWAAMTKNARAICWSLSGPAHALLLKHMSSFVLLTHTTTYNPLFHDKMVALKYKSNYKSFKITTLSKCWQHPGSANIASFESVIQRWTKFRRKFNQVTEHGEIFWWSVSFRNRRSTKSSIHKCLPNCRNIFFQKVEL